MKLNNLCIKCDSGDNSLFRSFDVTIECQGTLSNSAETYPFYTSITAASSNILKTPIDLASPADGSCTATMTCELYDGVCSTATPSLFTLTSGTISLNVNTGELSIERALSATNDNTVWQKCVSGANSHERDLLIKVKCEGTLEDNPTQSYPQVVSITNVAAFAETQPINVVDPTSPSCVAYKWCGLFHGPCAPGMSVFTQSSTTFQKLSGVELKVEI